MQPFPPPAPYRGERAILEIADWIADPVEPGDFEPRAIRFRHRPWSGAVGLDGLSEDEWLAHFGHFQPLPETLDTPLALRYHGHQFRVYNPHIGDGRGFLFAQLRDGMGRLLDLGTKGSGQTPYSRGGDGRLTLKGGVREVLASEMLEALGVYTSKSFSLIETNEHLWRDDEPSPTRASVLVRLSHGHIRIGSFQRLLALEEAEHMSQLVDYCLTHFPGPLPPEGAIGRDEPAVILMHQLIERLADLAASWVVAGFVHGVLNTDNINITGESFDYGPWRWLPSWDGGFTAAYFDHAGLYAFGRQAEAVLWNCGQMAVALRLICDSAPLIEAMGRFAPLYNAALARRWCWRLGMESQGEQQDLALVALCEKEMRERQWQPDYFFHVLRAGTWGQHELAPELAEALASRVPVEQDRQQQAYWQDEAVQSLLIEEVEAIWAPIAQSDDWRLFASKIAAIRRRGGALGPPPAPAGHSICPLPQ